MATISRRRAWRAGWARGSWRSWLRESGDGFTSRQRRSRNVARCGQPAGSQAASSLQAHGVSASPYGLRLWSDLFTPRQLVALTTFTDLVAEAREECSEDAWSPAWPDDDEASIRRDGATAYAEAISVYLAFAVDSIADYGNRRSATWTVGKPIVDSVKSSDPDDMGLCGRVSIC